LTIKKLIALVLCLCMMCSLLPAGALAAEETALEAVSLEDVEALLEVAESPAPEEEISPAEELPAEEISPEDSLSAEDDAEEESLSSETPEEPAVIQESIVHINPLYSDRVTESMIEGLSSDAVMLLSDPPAYAEGERDAAGAYFREAVKARAGTVVFSYTTDDYDRAAIWDDADYCKAVLSEIAYDLWGRAMTHTGQPDEGDYIRWNYDGWKVKANISRVGENVTFLLSFTMAYYTTYEQEELFAGEVERVLDEILTDGMSDYETVRTIYDYICDNVVYDYHHLNDDTYTLKQTAYAALINGTSVCQGYALLFYNMALRCGIDTRLIAGTSNEQLHGWNIVELGGVYYSLDSTWDAGRTTRKYFLRGTDNFSDHLMNGEFTTEEFLSVYPISALDYATVAAVASGTCGENLTWWLDNNGVLTVSGAGDMTNFASLSLVPWFDYRFRITSVVLENGVTSVGDYAFYYCRNMTRVVLPEGIASIGDDAFELCQALGAVAFPESLEHIGKDAFSECNSLTSVTIPAAVSEINKCAFEECAALESIWVSPENQFYASDEHGLLFSKEMTILYVCPAAFAGDYTVPDTVTDIADFAFESCVGLTGVTIPGSVLHIGEEAFQNCESLAAVTLGEGLEYIGECAFQNCPALTEISIPATVHDVEEEAFEGSGLTDVTVPGDACVFGDHEGTLGDPEVTRIHCGAVSTAAEYGREYGYTLCIFEDLDDSGDLDARDIVVLMKYVIGADASESMETMDVNGDQRADILDIVCLVRLIARLAA